MIPNLENVSKMLKTKINSIKPKRKKKTKIGKGYKKKRIQSKKQIGGKRRRRKTNKKKV